MTQGHVARKPQQAAGRADVIGTTVINLLARLPLGLGRAGMTGPTAEGADGTDRRPDLPVAQGRIFVTRDAYLAHVERLSAIAIPWYRRRPHGSDRMIHRRKLCTAAQDPYPSANA